MNFGWAIEQLKNGKRVARAGWNGKEMWIRLVGAHDGDPTRTPTYPVRSYLEMKDAAGWLVPWVTSQTDVLAEDWELAT